MNKYTRSLNIKLVAVFCVLALVVITLSFFLLNLENKSPVGKETTVYDKTTGEEYGSGEGKDVESVGTNPSAPLLLGFSNLISYGITHDDNVVIKSTVSDYILSDARYKPKSKVSLDKKTFTQKNNEDFTADYSFSIVINDAETDVIFVHTDSISSITVKIKDSSGKEVYSR